MNFNRRNLLKGIGVATASMTFLGTASANDKAQYIVVQSGNARGRIERAGFEVQRELAGGDVLQVAGSADSTAELEGIGGVQHAVENLSFGLDQTGLREEVDDELDDPPALWNDQWDKHVQDVPAAHAKATGEGTTVAILDTGIDPQHPDLAPNVDTEASQLFSSGDPIPADDNPWDMDGHGTHVAGTVGATGEFGVLGTAPDTTLVSLKVFWHEEAPDDEEEEYVLTTTLADILAAIHAAGQIGADAANMSLGTPPLPPEYNSTGVRAAYQRVISDANNHGTVVVASAGNSEANLQQGGYFTTPNSTASALSVSATAPNDKRSFYSNFGTNEIDVGAPGGGYETLEKTLEEDPTEVEWPFPLNLVLSTYPEGGYAWLAGTSMAAPQVSGIVALVRDLDPDANANQVESAIKHGAEGVSGRSDTDLGAGRVNAANTVERVDK